MNRGVEIDSDVADLPRSVIEDQVTNGIAIRMSLLYLLLGGTADDGEAARGGERMSELLLGRARRGSGLRPRRDRRRPDRGRADRRVGGGSRAGATVVDADGLVLAPGLVDLHTHLREPGREDKETVETGCRAAALGGFTAVSPMANTEPGGRQRRP